MKSSVLLVSMMLMLMLTLTSAFTAGRLSTSTAATELHMTMSRRDWFKASACFGIAAGAFAQPSNAKMPTEPLTEENKNAAWDDLKFELIDPKGGVSIMQSLINDKDFVGLLEFTKSYDLNVRKLKVGRCKAYLSSIEKAIATMTANAITFDLIGINRSARAGQENQSECNRYLNELRTDLQLVIDQKATVDMDALLFAQSSK